MAIDNAVAWLAITAAAAAAWALRYSGFAIMQRVEITPQLRLFLERMSTSVLVAIVASALATGGIRTAFAVMVGVGAMVVTRSPIVAMLVGVATAAGWSSALG